jgi:pyruvate dehydrogenase (quinone)
MESSCCGEIHLVNGLYDSNKAENPFIAIVSNIHTGKMGLDNFQKTSPVSLFQDCSNYGFQANTPKQTRNKKNISLLKGNPAS